MHRRWRHDAFGRNRHSHWRSMNSDELLKIVFDTIRTEMEPAGFVVRQKPKRKVPILIRDSSESLHLIWLFRDSLTRKQKLVVRLEFGVFSKVLGADDYPEVLEKPMSCMWYFCHWVGYSNPDFHHPSENHTVTTEAEAISTGREMLGFLHRSFCPASENSRMPQGCWSISKPRGAKRAIPSSKRSRWTFSRGI